MRREQLTPEEMNMSRYVADGAIVGSSGGSTTTRSPQSWRKNRRKVAPETQGPVHTHRARPAFQLVAGEGFEPSTFGVMRQQKVLSPAPRCSRAVPLTWRFARTYMTSSPVCSRALLRHVAESTAPRVMQNDVPRCVALRPAQPLRALLGLSLRGIPVRHFWATPASPISRSYESRGAVASAV